MPRELPKRKKTVLCSNIDAIKAASQKLMYKFPINSETYEIMSKIIANAVTVKEQALAMEKRLYLYKETIEGLGFKRVRKSYKRA